MEIRGSVDVPASQTAVWHFLATPEQISQCVPNLTSWHAITPNRCYQLLVQWPLTPQRGLKVPITLEWLDAAPPTNLQLQLTFQFQQQTIKSITHLTLIPAARQQTELSFHANIESPNRFMKQLIKNRAPKIIDTFFKSFKSQLQHKTMKDQITREASV